MQCFCALISWMADHPQRMSSFLPLFCTSLTSLTPCAACMMSWQQNHALQGIPVRGKACIQAPFGWTNITDFSLTRS